MLALAFPAMPPPTPTNCKDCGSTELAKRGNSVRNRCVKCYNAHSRILYHSNPRSLEVRKALYQKHAEKRRAESAARKASNRERYTLMEWFRRKGISTASIPDGDLDALVAMKKAIKESKEATKQNQKR